MQAGKTFISLHDVLKTGKINIKLTNPKGI